MTPSRCKNCVWWDHQHASLKSVPAEFGNVGFCRKHKPVIFSEGKFYRGGWPLVDWADLCGEFRQDETLEAANAR